jgi:hypothetical protein
MKHLLVDNRGIVTMNQSPAAIGQVRSLWELMVGCHGVTSLVEPSLHRGHHSTLYQHQFAPWEQVKVKWLQRVSSKGLLDGGFVIKSRERTRKSGHSESSIVVSSLC